MNNCSGCGSCENEIEKYQNITGPGIFNTVGTNCGVVLVGNSKVGKSTLFNRVCSRQPEEMYFKCLRRRVEKGVTGKFKTEVFNTPGILSIFTKNDEERVARDILFPGARQNIISRIAIVADAKNLKRSVSLALQFAEYGLPMIFILNMVDEASTNRIQIDSEKLSAILGIPVCETVARSGVGVDEVMAALNDMHMPCKQVEHTEDTEIFFKKVEDILPAGQLSHRAIGLQVLNGDMAVKKHIHKTCERGTFRQLLQLADEYNNNYIESPGVGFGKFYNKKADDIVKLVQTVGVSSNKNFPARLGQWCMTPYTGLPIAACVLVIMYLFVGSLGATFLVDTINSRIFEAYLIPKVIQFVEPIPSTFIKDMIVDPDFGIIPTGVFLALGLVTPVLFCFYIAFGLLEDSGYLSRLAILLDRVFQKMGLNGKGVIPLVMGFSCVTMAILTTRLLDTEKEKNIVSFLLLLGMPCAPLLAVMLVILEKMPITASILVFGLIVSQILIAGYLANKILFGVRSPLIMEIQPMRLPRASLVIKMAAVKTFYFIKEALPVFVLASLVVFLFERMGGLLMLEKIFEPVISGLMGLPEKSVQVFIKTIIRRESGATEIQHLSSIYDNLQLVVNLLVMTFLSPCINATIVLIKERGAKMAVSIMIAVMIYAVIVGTVVNHTCRILGVTFT